MIAPCAPVEQASTARGARNFVPKKVRLREEPLHPQPRCAHLCPASGKIDGPPPKTPDTPLPSAVHRLLPKNPKCEKRLAASHPSPPAHMAGRDQRRRSPAERKRIALALRPESLPMLALAEQKRCSSNDRVPAASRHLSANADSTVLLLGFCRSYLPSSTLHHRTTNVLADLPMSCVVHRLSRAITVPSFFGRRHTPIASLCH